MIVKLVVFIAIALLVWRLFAGLDPASRKRWGVAVVVVVLAALAVTGHLSWLVAGIVSLAAGLRRFLPTILRYWPALASLLVSRRSVGADASASNEDGNGNKRKGGTMTRAEALAVLGLDGNPDRETIGEAHRRLIQRNHPDRGGSDYLASRINEARDVLLDTLAD